MERRWHVVQTEPQREARVAERLVAHSFDVFNPRIRKRVRVNGVRSRFVMRPMLPGYTFVRFDPLRDAWWIIRRNQPGLPGVLRVLSWGERPVPVLDGVIEHLREREFALNRNRRRAPPIALKPSSYVRILAPLCFQGLFGVVTRILERSRTVDVEIDLFGRAVPMRLAPEQLEAV
jgi:transcription antitermination factor NusG